VAGLLVRGILGAGMGQVHLVRGMLGARYGHVLCYVEC